MIAVSYNTFNIGSESYFQLYQQLIAELNDTNYILTFNSDCLIIISQLKFHFKSMINMLLRMPNVQINIYSAIYVNDNYQLQSVFKNESIEIFGASVGRLNFDNPADAAKTINEWVSHSGRTKS